MSDEPDLQESVFEASRRRLLLAGMRHTNARKAGLITNEMYEQDMAELNRLYEQSIKREKRIKELAEMRAQLESLKR